MTRDDGGVVTNAGPEWVEACDMALRLALSGEDDGRSGDVEGTKLSLALIAAIRSIGVDLPTNATENLTRLLYACTRLTHTATAAALKSSPGGLHGLTDDVPGVLIAAHAAMTE